MLRLILIALVLLIFFITNIILLPVEWVIGKVNPRAKEVSSLAIVRFMFKLILFLAGTKTTIIGLENIPKDEPVVFIGNHHGFFDTIVSYSLM